jgi:hypothetical protein
MRLMRDRLSKTSERQAESHGEQGRGAQTDAT